MTMNRRDNWDPLTGEIIGAAMDVHRYLGPGLLEKVYHDALCIELAERNLRFEREKVVRVNYKGHIIGDYRLDVLVEDRVILELKSVKEILPVHEAQLISYLRLTGLHIGLLINFNVAVLRKGIRRRAA